MALFVNGVDQGGDHTGTTVTANNVQFPAVQSASADANNLDDYEEGTWTPTIQDSSLSDAESQTYSAQVGRYVKIGKQVFISCRVSVSSLGTLTAGDTASLGGLPFTSATIANVVFSMSVGYCDNLAITANQSVEAHVGSNLGVVSLRLWDAAAGVTGLLISEISADGIISLAGFYEV